MSDKKENKSDKKENKVVNMMVKSQGNQQIVKNFVSKFFRKSDVDMSKVTTKVQQQVMSRVAEKLSALQDQNMPKSEMEEHLRNTATSWLGKYTRK